MEILNSLNDLKTKKCIGLTIGNFDGVHKGHSAFLEKVQNECKLNDYLFVVVTFNPHPSFILRNAESFLINSYEERRELLSAHDVDILVELPFNRDFSTLEPEDFLKDYIFQSGDVKKMFFGYDFAFGANKKGDFGFAQSFCKNINVDIELEEKVIVSNEIASSSIIREHLRKGEVECANKFLGRDFFITGTIIKGKGRGKQIGFATANTEVKKDRLIPAGGVYSTEVLYKGGHYKSLTNIGYNPTFGDLNKLSVETHLLDFDEDIYGEKIKVIFKSKLREEMKFNSVNELISQIKLDVELRIKI
jgi:riboflavin kinase/FMN adenylyltransferase